MAFLSRSPEPAPMRTCSCCQQQPLQAVMVKALDVPVGAGERTVLFAKTIACLTCPRCDHGADQASSGLHHEIRNTEPPQPA